jgi:Ca-activated chloride channel family protein
MLAAVAVAVAGCGGAVDDYGAAGADQGYQGPPSQNRQAPPEEQDRQDGNNYDETAVTPFHSTDEKSTSTFSIDVDNGSYTLMRQAVQDGTLPKPAGVRAEEYINFFQYDYPEPQGEHPFSVTTEVGPSRFGPEEGKLMRIGLNGKSIAPGQLDPMNLVFLIDVSGSMGSPNKLPLVKSSLRTLLDHLRPQDSVGIVVYAGSDGVVLEPTPGDQTQKIESAIDNLQSGGSTNGEAGIVRAYEMAENARKQDGINRVLIATDGNFNVGRTGEDLVDYVSGYRDKHISLTMLGYGNGNYNDALVEKLTHEANGNYFFVDGQKEADRIFGPALASTLEVIASDVKIQVEFDQETVEKYRLIGYDNRALDNEDFADDSKDAGEIGPGHTVTAFYEFVPTEQVAPQGEVAEVRLRYKDEYGEQSKLLKRQVESQGLTAPLEQKSKDFRFGAAVAEYAEILRESRYSEGARFDDVKSMAQSATKDRDRRREFVDLVDQASGMWSK